MQTEYQPRPADMSTVMKDPRDPFVLDLPPVTDASVEAAIDAANRERAEAATVTGIVLPTVERRSVYERLDDFRKDERCGHDLVADAISLHLYGKHADELPREVRSRVERSALRALRGAQPAWQGEALKRAVLTHDRAMVEEMGRAYAGQAPERRKALAYIAVHVVQAAFVGALEISDPFDGPGQAIKVYEAAQSDIREVK